MMTPETYNKRNQLAQFITNRLERLTPIQGVIAIGSVGLGEATANSDINVAVFLDPFDLYALPAEAVCSINHDCWYSSSTPEKGDIALNFLRLDWQKWSDPAYFWPEALRSELGLGWLAFDRHGDVAGILAQKSAYDEETRIKRLDEAIIWLDQHLSGNGPETRWVQLGVMIAHDRLRVSYSWLVRLLFAYNRCWLPWRNREMSVLRQLPWLPSDFETRILPAMNAPSYDYVGYMARVTVLRDLFHDTVQRLQAESVYGENPANEAFIRQNDEPGRVWNMAEWQREHHARYGQGGK